MFGQAYKSHTKTFNHAHLLPIMQKWPGDDKLHEALYTTVEVFTANNIDTHKTATQQQQQQQETTRTKV